MVGLLSPKQRISVRFPYPKHPKQRFVTIRVCYTRGYWVLLDLPREIWDNGLMKKQKTWFTASDGTKGSNVLVAKESGFTYTTILNVFNYPERVSSETIKKVLNAVAKLEYTVGKPTIKKCNKCKIAQPYTNFYCLDIEKDYFSSECKKCEYKKSQKYYNENKHKISKKASNKHRMNKYGITEEQYNDILLSQNSLCGICNKPSDKTLHVDHNHKTGKIRGLLCSGCNTGIGFFNEDIDSLTNAVKYLKSFLDSPEI